MDSSAVWGAVVLLILLLFAAPQLPKLWRGDENYLRRLELTLGTWWPFDDVLWRGWRRAMPLGVVTAAALAGTVFLGFALETLEIGGKVVVVIAMAAGGVLIGCFALGVTIALFNWPKLIVPPPFRDEKGAVAEWLNKVRERTRDD